MAEEQTSGSVHDRRITWSLIAIVVGFVLLMTCIVLWITSALIRNDISGSSESTPSPTSTQRIVVETPTPTPSPTPTDTRRASQTPILAEQTPILVEATWTPVKSKTYVKFVYWKVRPNTITQGECIQLTWEIEYAASLQLYRDGELIMENPPPKTTIQDCPTRVGYVVYRMVGENSAGVSNWVQLQVRVKKAP